MSIGDELTAASVRVTRSEYLAAVPEPGSNEYLQLAHTDHMLVAKWSAQGGWDSPCIKPYGELGILPTASSLHYATECFEGLKAYRGEDSRLRLFRPDENGERLQMSAKRASLPTVQPDQLKYLIEKLLEIEGPRWLPKDQPRQFLYIRPAIIGTGHQLSFGIPQEALFFIVAAPYPDMSKVVRSRGTSNAGLKLVASPPGYTRSWPGGVGYAKLGANYNPSLEAHSAAKASGFDQVLWTFGESQLVTEAGASNFFVIWRNKQTQALELVTATLEGDLILGGITRKSVLEVAKTRFSRRVGKFSSLTVIEREFSITEIEGAWKEDRLIEAFVSGTAYFITAVSLIRTATCDIEFPLLGEDKRYSAAIRGWIESITYGIESHEWSHIISDKA
ncbi:branched-chain amino acid aminotransferase cytosolic [Penicillium verhagenii]|uniref:branched-chain amino acid aminotransferase cytosolic n=1 Tax=Penicillium verhagenii TaxID=1562060 RepID=UPI00254520D8|nr:branched-chain amino acid aminotransferase cytosolic [Penicillium verhagenii]KAJ5921461.1 branched-chain amino acid aminotransferase cytosolic [Penicillium verhagenii]